MPDPIELAADTLAKELLDVSLEYFAMKFKSKKLKTFFICSGTTYCVEVYTEDSTKKVGITKGHETPSYAWKEAIDKLWYYPQ